MYTECSNFPAVLLLVSCVSSLQCLVDMLSMIIAFTSHTQLLLNKDTVHLVLFNIGPGTYRNSIN